MRGWPTSPHPARDRTRGGPHRRGHRVQRRSDQRVAPPRTLGGTVARGLRPDRGRVLDRRRDSHRAHPRARRGRRCWRTRTSTKCWAAAKRRSSTSSPTPGPTSPTRTPRPTPASPTTSPCSPATPRASPTTPAFPRFARAEPGHPAAGRGSELRRLLRGLPAPGFTGCRSGEYAQKHAPVGGVHQPPAGREPALERVACRLRPTAHGRLRHPEPLQRHARLRVAPVTSGFARTCPTTLDWARTHNSLLIVTFDESESRRGSNGIVTLIDGAGVAAWAGRRADRPLPAVAHDRGDVPAARARKRRHHATDHRHLDLMTRGSCAVEVVGSVSLPASRYRRPRCPARSASATTTRPGPSRRAGRSR